jgi:hypothetical protein
VLSRKSCSDCHVNPITIPLDKLTIFCLLKTSENQDNFLIFLDTHSFDFPFHNPALEKLVIYAAENLRELECSFKMLQCNELPELTLNKLAIPIAYNLSGTSKVFWAFLCIRFDSYFFEAFCLNEFYPYKKHKIKFIGMNHLKIYLF